MVIRDYHYSKPTFAEAVVETAGQILESLKKFTRFLFYRLVGWQSRTRT